MPKLAEVKVIALPARTKEQEFAARQCAVLVKTARSLAHITQAELAELCEMPESRIAQAENGTGDIGVASLSLIVGKCGFRLQTDLVSEEDDCVEVGVCFSKPRG